MVQFRNGSGLWPRLRVRVLGFTNRQDWHPRASAQRGLVSPHAVPGLLSPREDAVYQLVTMIAGGYLGRRVWNPGLPAWVG